MNDEPKQICVLGGGFGGLYTALSLNRFVGVQNGEYQITLVEPKDHFLFTPLLYELITGELQRWEIAPSYQKLLHNTKINFCQHKVKNIDLKSRQVSLDNNQIISYNYLVLAVGCQNRWADIPGLATHALTFRTLEDTEKLQNRLHLLEVTQRQCLRLAVIGGGPNGVELACKLADRLGKRGQVSLIERGEDILKGFSKGVKDASWRSLTKRQVKVELNTNVAAIKADAIQLVQDNQVSEHPIDLVIWTAGIQSREWLRHLECPQTPQGKLLTHPTLQLISHPEVFALGDIAEIYNGKQLVPVTAQAAYQQSTYVAKNIQGMIQGKSLKAFRYLHLGDMLTLGRRSAIMSSFFVNIDGRIADIIRRVVYILRLPTFRHRLQVFRAWFIKVGLRTRQSWGWRLTQIWELISAKNY